MLVLLLALGLPPSAAGPAASASASAVAEAASVPLPGPPGAELATFRVDTLARTTTTFAMPPGPRTIQRFEWTASPDSGDWRTARLRLILDGKDPPPTGLKVDLPLRRFFHPVPPALRGPNGTWINDEPLPYVRGGRLILETRGPIRGTLRVVSIPGPPDRPTTIGSASSAEPQSKQAGILEPVPSVAGPPPLAIPHERVMQRNASQASSAGEGKGSTRPSSDPPSAEGPSAPALDPGTTSGPGRPRPAP